MLKIRNVRVEDVETVAKMAALDYHNDPEKGYREAKEHTLDHLKIVPQHCYAVEMMINKSLQPWFYIHKKTFLKSKIFT
jgi:hypothetical protein